MTSLEFGCDCSYFSITNQYSQSLWLERQRVFGWRNEHFQVRKQTFIIKASSFKMPEKIKNN